MLGLFDQLVGTFPPLVLQTRSLSYWQCSAGSFPASAGKNGFDVPTHVVLWGSGGGLTPKGGGLP